VDVKLINTTNPASFGVEWEAGETGNSYALMCDRGTTALFFGVRTAQSDGWVSQKVIAPERFGLTAPPKTHAEFVKVAEAYVSG
jgi:hypothetical protein